MWPERPNLWDTDIVLLQLHMTLFAALPQKTFYTCSMFNVSCYNLMLATLIWYFPFNMCSENRKTLNLVSDSLPTELTTNRVQFQVPIIENWQLTHHQTAICSNSRKHLMHLVPTITSLANEKDRCVFSKFIACKAFQSIVWYDKFFQHRINSFLVWSTFHNFMDLFSAISVLPLVSSSLATYSLASAPASRFKT